MGQLWKVPRGRHEGCRWGWSINEAFRYIRLCFELLSAVLYRTCHTSGITLNFWAVPRQPTLMLPLFVLPSPVPHHLQVRTTQCHITCKLASPLLPVVFYIPPSVPHHL
jgi:hypothetical protein